MIKAIKVFRQLRPGLYIMIDERKILEILGNPSYSLPEMKEQLAKLDTEYEDIEHFITLNIGDTRFPKKTAKHRGTTRRILK